MYMQLCVCVRACMQIRQMHLHSTKGSGSSAPSGDGNDAQHRTHEALCRQRGQGTSVLAIRTQESVPSLKVNEV